jgi:hypothetical protein
MGQQYLKIAEDIGISENMIFDVKKLLNVGVDLMLQ